MAEQLENEIGVSESERVSDEALVAACLNGEFSAWTQLVERYAALVHSVPSRHGLSPMEVDDVGQEVFLALARNLDRIEHPERLSAWLVITTRRLTWRALKRRNREQVVEHDDLSDQNLPQEVSGLEDLLDGWHRREALQKAFSYLESPCRELLILLFLDVSEPSYEEISQRLSMSKGSIGPTRNRCLAKLRSILEGLGYIPD